MAAELNSSGRFEQTVAVVTGASRGIGAAVARRLGGLGVQLVLVARTVGGLEETDDAIRKAGGKPALLVPFDLGSADPAIASKLDVLGEHVYAKYGRADFLLGLAGTLGALEPTAHMDPARCQNIMTVNMLANQRLIRSLDPLLRQAPAGRVAFATCSLGDQTQAYWSAYRASKAALEQMAFSYAIEMKTTNVRVNLVDPGPVRGKLFAAAFPGIAPESLPSPDDVADLFVNAISPGFERTGEILRAPAAVAAA